MSDGAGAVLLVSEKILKQFKLELHRLSSNITPNVSMTRGCPRQRSDQCATEY